MKRKLSFIPAFFTAISLLIIACVAFVAVNRPALDVVKSWKQSNHITYNSYDPYFLNVVKDNLDYGHIPFTISRRYFIYVGKENNQVTYGHIKDYSFEYNTGIKAYLEKCAVNWIPEGVEFIEPSGHKLFIPKSMFSGGR